MRVGHCTYDTNVDAYNSDIVYHKKIFAEYTTMIKNRRIFSMLIVFKETQIFS